MARRWRQDVNDVEPFGSHGFETGVIRNAIFGGGILGTGLIFVDNPGNFDAIQSPQRAHVVFADVTGSKQPNAKFSRLIHLMRQSKTTSSHQSLDVLTTTLWSKFWSFG